MTPTHRFVIGFIAGTWAFAMAIVLMHIARELSVLSGWPVCHG